MVEANLHDHVKKQLFVHCRASMIIGNQPLTVYVLYHDIQIIHLQSTHSSYYIHFISPHTLKVASNVPYWEFPSPPPCSQILNTHTLAFVEMLLNDVLLSLIYSPLCLQKKMTAYLFEKWGGQAQQCWQCSILNYCPGLVVKQDPLLEGSVLLSSDLIKIDFFLQKKV